MDILNLRLAVASDIPALMELERQCATAAHWTEQQYRQVFHGSEQPNSRRLALVVEETGERGQEEIPALLAFLVAHHVPPEWELENIVVAPAARRKGVATLLLREFLDRASPTNSEAVFLEVRESNAAARALYEKHGFKETGTRKAYYAGPVEDAIVYRRDLARTS
jgi:[ribosomal protein S18]-alanine N-acetyltransferase